MDYLFYMQEIILHNNKKVEVLDLSQINKELDRWKIYAGLDILLLGGENTTYCYMLNKKQIIHHV